jgi:hypothetical protein
VSSKSLIEWLLTKNPITISFSASSAINVLHGHRLYFERKTIFTTHIKERAVFLKCEAKVTMLRRECESTCYLLGYSWTSIVA